MYAYAEIKGHQFRLEPGKEIKVPLFKNEPGDTIEIAPLSAYNDGKTSLFGEDCKDFSAKATVVSHGRDPKILVFHKKRRKGYKKSQGHRQDFTTLKIDEIVKAQETE